jgi:hypothetical protein
MMIFLQKCHPGALAGRNDQLADKLDLASVNSCYPTRQFIGSQSRPENPI